MIFAFLCGFLLGSLTINVFLKDEEEKNKELKDINLKLKEEIDKSQYLLKIYESKEEE